MFNATGTSLIRDLRTASRSRRRDRFVCGSSPGRCISVVAGSQPAGELRTLHHPIIARMKRLVLVIFVAACAAAPAPQPQPQPQSSAPPPSTIESKPAKLQKLDGFIPLYWDAENGKLLMQVSRFGEELLYYTSLPAGLGSNPIGLDRGQTGEGIVVEFERIGPKVLMIAPNYRFR